MSLSQENQADITEAFNSTLRYLDDLLNIDNIYFDQMLDRIYPTELQLNRANSSHTEVPFLELNLCMSNGTVCTRIYDKWDAFFFLFFFIQLTISIKYMYRQNICYISICGKLTNVRLESSTNDPSACVTYMFIIL